MSRLAGLVATLAVLLVACGSGQGSASSGPVPTAGSEPDHQQGEGVTQSPSPPPVGAAPARSLTVGDDDNGRSVTLARGGRLTVVLGSTYWTFQGSSNPSVLRPRGSSQTKPGSGCPPGGGCGAVSLDFEAVAAGQADVTASRSSCGEAMACTGGRGSFRVTVVVSS
jgi:hypothetical protein